MKFADKKNIQAFALKQSTPGGQLLPKSSITMLLPEKSVLPSLKAHVMLKSMLSYLFKIWFVKIVNNKFNHFKISEPGTVMLVLDLLVKLPTFMDLTKESMLSLQLWKVKHSANLKKWGQMKRQCINASEKSSILCQKPCMLLEWLCMYNHTISAEIGSTVFAIMINKKYRTAYLK